MHAVSRVLAVATMVAAALIPAVPTASAGPRWAPAGKATIHPGVQTFTNGAQCTANFVFRSGATVYIGQAAHCSGTGDSTETDGCTSKSLPIGTKVKVGDVVTGTMVYNSWITMQKRHEKRPNVCAYNDLALIKLPPSAVAKVNPSVPFWGGPTGVGGATASGDTVVQLRQLRAARRRHHPEPEARREPRRRRQRMEPHRLHRVARHPRRLGQRVPEREGQGDRRPVDDHARANRRQQRCRRPPARARVHALAHGVAGHAGARHRAVPAQRRRLRRRPATSSSCCRTGR